MIILKAAKNRTVCFCHVTYGFQSESTLYSCLNVKELLAQNRRKIWSLSDCNWTQTLNHLVCKRTLNHLAKQTSLVKWLSVCLRTKCLWVWVQVYSQKTGFWPLFIGYIFRKTAGGSLTLKFKWPNFTSYFSISKNSSTYFWRHCFCFWIILTVLILFIKVTLIWLIIYHIHQLLLSFVILLFCEKILIRT